MRVHPPLREVRRTFFYESRSCYWARRCDISPVSSPTSCISCGRMCCKPDARTDPRNNGLLTVQRSKWDCAFATAILWVASCSKMALLPSTMLKLTFAKRGSAFPLKCFDQVGPVKEVDSSFSCMRFTSAAIFLAVSATRRVFVDIEQLLFRPIACSVNVGPRRPDFEKDVE